MDRNNNINCVHLLSATMVVFGHQFNLMGITECPVALGMNIHELGVRILFIVSGFLITKSYMRSKDIFEYLKKRVL